MYSDHSWLQAQEHFRKTDRKLFETLLKLQDNGTELTPITAKDPSTYFENIVESIVSQQLSVKASDTIFQRLVALVKAVEPQNILDANIEDMRQAGISYSKINYIKGIAQAVVVKMINLQYLAFLTEEEIITQLTTLKGIGKWSAEMFMMFTLGNPNVFSLGDGGLRNAFMNIYKLDFKQKQDLEIINKIISSYSPYKTYAAKILWKSLDNEPKL
jgi:DNA-3-methyladenine glycosylase II